MKKTIYITLLLSLISINIGALELITEDLICTPKDERLPNQQIVVKENGNMEIWYKAKKSENDGIKETWYMTKIIENVCTKNGSSIKCIWHPTRNLTVSTEDLLGTLNTYSLKEIPVTCE